MNVELPIEIDVRAVKELRDLNESFLLLDVRQPEEFEIARIDGSLLIPMGELRERLNELEPHRGEPIVVQCHHGIRSMQVTQALRAHGFDRVQNMAGGIEAWSLEVDPAVPRY